MRLLKALPVIAVTVTTLTTISLGVELIHVRKQLQDAQKVLEDQDIALSAGIAALEKCAKVLAREQARNSL